MQRISKVTLRFCFYLTFYRTHYFIYLTEQRPLTHYAQSNFHNNGGYIHVVTNLIFPPVVKGSSCIHISSILSFVCSSIHLIVLKVYPDAKISYGLTRIGGENWVWNVKDTKRVFSWRKTALNVDTDKLTPLVPIVRQFVYLMTLHIDVTIGILYLHICYVWL